MSDTFPRLTRHVRRKGLALAAFSLALLPLAGPISSAAAQNSFSDAQKREIEAIVKDYLVQNPDVMIEVFDALQAKQDAEEQERSAAAIEDNADALFNDPMAYVYGNPDGDITIVEFFDYRCGYCKRSFEPLTDFVREDGNVRLILKELPILSEESEYAAKAALAAQRQDKYWPLHKMMMETDQPLTQDAVIAMASKVGIDTKKLLKDMQDPEIMEEITQNEELAQMIGVTGTPGFVYDGSVRSGADFLHDLPDLVAEARGK